MRIGVTGVTGFVGGCFGQEARAAGHEVVGFSRGGTGMRLFSLEKPCDCSDLDAVVHFAGEPVFGLWTRAKRRRIFESRTLGTRRVVEGLRRVAPGPAVLVSASAVGFYGDTGEAVCDESSPPGGGFLAGVTRAWEAEALRAEDFGVRVVLLRIGFVLGGGGALRLIRPLFRMGLGGRLGNGKQWMSGVHVEDVACMALQALEDTSLRGPVNGVMPEPFRNEEFTRALGRVLHRPTGLPVPSAALRLALGPLARLMLDSCRVVPAGALASGYKFRHASLDAALRAALLCRPDDTN
jgi:uncharacterized protein